MFSSLKELCAVHGSPFYVYSAEKIRRQVEAVKENFPSFNIIYSVKCNPFEPILQILLNMGVGIDAASRNEVLSAARLGHRDIYYSAPGKTRRDIATCLRSSRIIADSLGELKLINAIAGEAGITAKVGVRINPDNEGMAASRFEVMSGVTGKFGIGWDEFVNAGEAIGGFKNIQINGLHVYFGSQLLSEEQILANFKIISQTALNMSGFPLEYVNYGGGFGVPYEADEPPLDLKKLAALLDNDADTQLIARKGIRRNLELGRYLVAEAGLFVCSVADVKRRGGEVYAILDCGMNAFFRPKFTGQFHKVSVLDAEGREVERVHLVGNTCTPLDVFYDDIELPALRTGDIIVFENAGAYGYSMSMLDFISFDKPAQIMLRA